MNLILALAALLPWSALHPSQTLTLQQDWALETVQTAPGQNTSFIAVPKNSQLTVDDFMPLDEIQVEYYEMSWKDCPDVLRNRTSEITIVKDVYGVELLPGCRLGVYVEYKDIESESPFTEAAPASAFNPQF